MDEKLIVSTYFDIESDIWIIKYTTYKEEMLDGMGGNINAGVLMTQISVEVYTLDS